MKSELYKPTWSVDIHPKAATSLPRVTEAKMENLLEVLGRRFKHSKGSIQNSIVLLIVYGFEEFIRTQLLR